MIQQEPPEVPAIIEAWVRQLLDPTFVSMIHAMRAEQIDIRLSAARGKVRPRPIIMFNGGPSELVDPLHGS